MTKSHASNAHAVINRNTWAGHQVELDTGPSPTRSRANAHHRPGVHPATIPGFDRLVGHVDLPVAGASGWPEREGRNARAVEAEAARKSRRPGTTRESCGAGDIEGVTGTAAPAGPSTHRIEEGPGRPSAG